MTGGRARRGRGSSEVESWTGAPLGILRRVDGDEDFAPRVLAMAMSADGRKCVRLAQAKEANERVLWLGSSWPLFKVQIKV